MLDAVIDAQGEVSECTVRIIATVERQQKACDRCLEAMREVCKLDTGGRQPFGVRLISALVFEASGASSTVASSWSRDCSRG